MPKEWEESNARRSRPVSFARMASNFVARWPNGDVVLSFGLSKRQLQQQLDEAGDPGDCVLSELPRHGMLEFTQERAMAHAADDDFVSVRSVGAAAARR